MSKSETISKGAMAKAVAAALRRRVGNAPTERGGYSVRENFDRDEIVH
jgi:hypothetical protein